MLFDCMSLPAGFAEVNAVIDFNWVHALLNPPKINTKSRCADPVKCFLVILRQ